MCQRASGAPVVAWGNVPIEGSAFTKGPDKARRAHRAKDHNERDSPSNAGEQESRAEIGMPNMLVFVEFLGLAFERDAARFKHIAVAGEAQSKFGILFDEDHGHAPLIHLPDDLGDLVDQDG